jgi:hypothetical protein
MAIHVQSAPQAMYDRDAGRLLEDFSTINRFKDDDERWLEG